MSLCFITLQRYIWMIQKDLVLLQSYILIAMARLARQQSGTGIYHVMLRGKKIKKRMI